jgi:hypothetical protein
MIRILISFMALVTWTLLIYFIFKKILKLLTFVDYVLGAFV